MKQLKILLAALLSFAVVACSTGPKIEPGSVVKIEYTGTLSDGSVFDTTDGKGPLTFLMGAGQVLPKFEEQVAKISAGKTRQFTIKAEDAYGKPDPNKVVTLPRDQRFAGVELKEGSIIFANNKLPNGQVKQTPMKVVKLSDKEVTMDYNHPLSGKDLTFKVTVVDVQKPQAPTAAPQAQAQQEQAQQQQQAAAQQAAQEQQAQQTNNQANQQQKQG